MPPNLSPSIEREIGSTSAYTSTFGFPWDISEDNPELAWPHSIIVYDKMRRDSQVMGTLNAVTLPLRQARWFVDPRSARPAVAQQIADDLGLGVLGDDPVPAPRMKDRFSWSEHLRMAMLELVYGHMPFEQVYRIDDSGPTPMARLRKLAPRMPRTLLKINTADDGGLKSIVQMTATANQPEVTIPVDRLVFYCNDREGSAWQGNSILRPAYKNWTLKDRLLRVASMTIERNGMGVPTMEAPQGATPGQLQELAAMAERYRAGDSSGAAIPYGARLRLNGVEGTLPDPLPLIRYHDEQITRPMLEMFMQLGSTQTGSRALGSSFVDFFQMALNAFAEQLSQVATEHIVEDLVDLNWGGTEPSPAVVCQVIDAETDIPPESLVKLLQVGAIEMDDDLETFLRDRYGMPDRNTSETARPPRSTGGAPGGPPVARRSRRPFGTEVHAAKVPAKRYTDRLVEHYKPLVAQAIRAAVDVDKVVASAQAGQKIVVDLAPVKDLLVEMIGESWLVGVHVAGETLAKAHKTRAARVRAASNVKVTLPDYDAEVDWDNWEPGNNAAAVELAFSDESGGLADLLDDAGVTIKGLDETTIELLGDTLGEGMSNGEAIRDLASRVVDVVGDESRGEIIARTESARASSVASMDTYRANDVGQKEWLVDGDPCQVCLDNADDSPVAIDDVFGSGDSEPPAHPNCECAILPVLDESS